MNLQTRQIVQRVATRALDRVTDAARRGEGTRNPISLTDFKRTMYRRYQHPRHLEFLDQQVTEVIRYVETQGREGIWFLIVEEPPRHGKTLTISRLLPPWFLGRNPDCRVMLVSYGATLAHKNGRYVRNLMLSPKYERLYGITLAQGSQAVDAFDIAGHEGGLDALGVLGGTTGKGAHLLILDDLIKNREEAESELIRDKTWDALIDDLLTRLEPGGAVIMPNTRWHMDDPAGRVVKMLAEQLPGQIERIRLPAIAEDDDPLNRAEGEALWPERYPIDVLRQKELTMSAYSWSALYQQNPVPTEGGLFKRAWFEPWIDTLPEIVNTVRYWDLAMSDKESADYTAGVKMGYGIDGHVYVLDVVHKRLDWGDLTPFLADVMLADGPNIPQGIEEKGYMTRAIQNLNSDPRLRNYAIFGYPVDTKKFVRALPYAAKCGAGLVHVLNRHWTQRYVEELCMFTGTGDETDDQVDASSGAWVMLDSGIADTATSFDPIRTGLERVW